jgi:hypothetical protein
MTVAIEEDAYAPIAVARILRRQLLHRAITGASFAALRDP